MLRQDYTFQQKIEELREREKELKTLYKVEEVIKQNLPLPDFFMQIVKRLYSGWQYPDICRLKITFEGKEYCEKHWEETEWVQQADIVIDDNVLGKIEVFYTTFRKMVTDSQFLPEEQKLLNTIATRISAYIFSKRLEKSIEVLKKEKDKPDDENSPILFRPSDSHWIWRKNMVEIIAQKIDFDRFNIKGLYLIGSTKNATAGPASDIDILVHAGNDQGKLNEMMAWFEGWSLCLSEMNYQKTGYKTKGLIDLHVINDDDIRNKTSFAVMIGNLNDGAKPIKVKE